MMGDFFGIIAVGGIAFLVGASYGHKELADTISADCTNNREFKLSGVKYDCLPLSFERDGKEYQIILEQNK